MQLYAGAGYRATFLSDGERQAIFEQEMLPRLEAGDLDGALFVALERVDAAATPEHAANLARARTVDAVVGLFAAPIVGILLLAWVVLAWSRHGRDPVYLDDPSILMPAPPAELTPATAALVMDGSSTRRALTTAMLDLASRGELGFREETSGLLGHTKKVGIEVAPGAAATEEAERERRKARRQPLGTAEDYALRHLSALATDGYVDPTRLLDFGKDVGGFDERLEQDAADRGWFTERPRPPRRAGSCGPASRSRRVSASACWARTCRAKAWSSSPSPSSWPGS
ncbi:MAG TPA: hypothetical protein VIV06_03320 [Candidatus Limnocylindrales bacterium]